MRMPWQSVALRNKRESARHTQVDNEHFAARQADQQILSAARNFTYFAAAHQAGKIRLAKCEAQAPNAAIQQIESCVRVVPLKAGGGQIRLQEVPAFPM